MDATGTRISVFRSMVAVATLLLWVLNTGPFGWSRATAQSTENAPTPLTLHAYENLMQFPVVVLDEQRIPVPPVSAERFSVSLSSGPRFHPAHVRMESDDPISLSILVDLRSGQEELAKRLGGTVAELGAGPLVSRDRVSIYLADDCRIRRILFYAKATLPELKEAVDTEVEDFRQRARKQGGSSHCNREQGLWNALAYVATQAAALPGRRVILAITNDPTGHSQLTWQQVKRMASLSGVAIFGLKAASVPSFRFDDPTSHFEDTYDSLCELTGGLVFTATAKSLDRRLREFVNLLRGRYIVEFPRPDNAPGGDYTIQVSVQNFKGLIHSAGLSVPISDPKLLSDPNTVRRNPSSEPPVGSRRALPMPPP